MVSFIVFWEVMLREVVASFIVFLEVIVSFIVFWEVMLRGCGLFHCVLGGYVERLWSLSLCFGRLC